MRSPRSTEVKQKRHAERFRCSKAHLQLSAASASVALPWLLRATPDAIEAAATAVPCSLAVPRAVPSTSSCSRAPALTCWKIIFLPAEPQLAAGTMHNYPLSHAGDFDFCHHIIIVSILLQSALFLDDGRCPSDGT
jgi:hypothetical protein